MTGRIIDLSRNLSGTLRVTLELTQVDIATLETLKDIPILDVELKKHRKKRSKDANAYAWVLIDKIASAVSADKTTVYRQAIREIGGVSDIICVKNEAVASLRRGWEHNGLGWPTDVLPSKIKGCTNVILYYGSSTYDTKQMSDLIEHLVSEAKSLGIETLTPEELSRMIGDAK